MPVNRGSSSREDRITQPYEKTQGFISTNRVYIGNLSFDCRWQDLKDHFKTIGPVAHAEIIEQRDGRSKGCGIVEYQYSSDASKAIDELNDTELMGRQVFVREDRIGRQDRSNNDYRRNNGRDDRSRGDLRGASSGGETKLFVNNLDFSTRWQELKDHFRSCNIKHADVMTGPDGRSKGCGLVTFDSVQDAIRAVREKDNTFLAGRKISVREDRIN